MIRRGRLRTGAGLALRIVVQRAAQKGRGLLLGEREETVLGIGFRCGRVAAGLTGQYLQCLSHRFHRINMKLTGLTGGHDLIAQHEITGVGLRHDGTLGAIQTEGRTGIEMTVNLLVHAANGLYVAMLIDGTGHGDTLTNGHAGQGADETAELGAGCGVTINATIALLKGDGRAESQRVLGAQHVAQQSAKDVEAFRMDAACLRCCAFDINHAGAPGADGSRKAGWKAIRVGYCRAC